MTFTVTFSQEKLAPAAVMAFRDLCIECTEVLAAEMAIFIEPYLTVYHSNSLKNREKVRRILENCFSIFSPVKTYFIIEVHTDLLNSIQSSDTILLVPLYTVFTSS